MVKMRPSTTTATASTTPKAANPSTKSNTQTKPTLNEENNRKRNMRDGKDDIKLKDQYHVTNPPSERCQVVRTREGQAKEDVKGIPETYLTRVTKEYWLGKKNKKLYPLDMTEFAIGQNGGPKKCHQCGQSFYSDFSYTICEDCRDRNQLKKWKEADFELPNALIMSIISDQFETEIDCFEASAREILGISYAEEISNDQIIEACRLVNPTPNFANQVEWENLTSDVQPEDDFVDPSNETQEAIRMLNECLKKESPVSYGPQWKTRLPLSQEVKEGQQ